MSCQCTAGILGQEDVVTLPPFAYSHLPTSDSIRLFTLFPGEAHSPIRGKLSDVRLDENERVEYFALSYTWGDSPLRHEIECNGCCLAVNCNLFCALKHLRSTYGPKHGPVLWFVDQICINQSVEAAWIHEREFLVRRMGIIYQRATVVTIFLGEEPEELPHVLQLMHALAKKPIAHWTYLVRETRFMAKINVPRFPLEIWHAFAKLCRRPWFERIWVIQELSLATRPEFLVGRTTFPVHVLFKAYPAMRLIHASPAFAISNLNRSSQIADLRKDIDHSFHYVTTMSIMYDRLRHPTVSPHPMCTVLSYTWDCKARDSRDKLYGVLNTLQEHHMKDFLVDYNETAEALCYRLSAHIVRHMQPIDLLYKLSSLDTDENASWVINFTRRPKSSSITIRSNYHHAGTGIGEPICSLSADGHHLSLKGIVLDRIQTRSISLIERRTSELNDPDLEKGPLEYYYEVRKWCIEAVRDVGKGTIRWKECSYLLTATAGGFGEPFFPDITIKDAKALTPDYFMHWFQRLPWRRHKLRKVFRTLVNILGFANHEQCIGITTKGTMSLIPDTAREGDDLVLFRGFPTPFLVRPHQDGYKLLGSAYVDGVMKGEATELFAEHETTITLC